MKSILSASLCTAALAFALPAMAQTDTSKPAHKHHHMGRMNHMQGPKTKSKRAGDPTTDELNAKSLAAARGGSAPAASASPTPATSASWRPTTRRAFRPQAAHPPRAAPAPPPRRTRPAAS